MENIIRSKEVKIRCLRIWKKFGKYIFGALALLALSVSVLLTEYTLSLSLYYVAGISASIMFLQLKIANIPINNWLVRLGWSLWDATLIIIISSFLELEYEGVKCFALGFFVSAFASSILYSMLIPWLSYKIGFIKSRTGCFNEKWNGVFVRWTLFFIIIAVEMGVTKKLANEREFAKECFVPITSWETEIHNGNTMYIIECSKGTFGVYPCEYPEVRQIHSGSMIKVLPSKQRTGSGTDKFELLEIKN